jgi:hypothetical protein
LGLLNLLHKAKLAKLVSKAIENPELLRTSKFWIELLEALWSVKEVRIMLAGYKTYVVAALTAVVTVAHSLGYINDSLYQTLLALLASGGIATVAAKMNRVNQDLKNNTMITQQAASNASIAANSANKASSLITNSGIGVDKTSKR